MRGSSLDRVLRGASLVAAELAKAAKATKGVPVIWRGSSGAGASSAEAGGSAPSSSSSSKQALARLATSVADGARARPSALPATASTPPPPPRSPPPPPPPPPLRQQPEPVQPPPRPAAPSEPEEAPAPLPDRLAEGKGLDAVSAESAAHAGGAASRERHNAVPAHAISRAMHFGGLGLGLAAGAAAQAVRRAIKPEEVPGPSSSLLVNDANVERLVSALTRLRGAALKVGQMLSFNDADVLPPELQQAMERVRDGADWMPGAQLEATLRAELGAEWRDGLAEFEELPVAAASIGQVHGGRCCVTLVARRRFSDSARRALLPGAPRHAERRAARRDQSAVRRRALLLQPARRVVR